MEMLVTYVLFDVIYIYVYYFFHFYWLTIQPIQEREKKYHFLSTSCCTDSSGTSVSSMVCYNSVASTFLGQSPNSF